MSQAIQIKSLAGATATGAGSILHMIDARTRHVLTVTLGGTVAATAGTQVDFEISPDAGTTWHALGSWKQDDPRASGEAIVLDAPATDVRAKLISLGSGGTASAVTAWITSDKD